MDALASDSKSDASASLQRLGKTHKAAKASGLRNFIAGLRSRGAKSEIITALSPLSYVDQHLAR